jgi:TolB-like protein/AraC-like DNA-binding protein
MELHTSMSDQFLNLINRIIEENLDNEHFSVDDLAGKAGLSRSMLHRKLIKLIGKSASDLITEKRLLRAKELLENNVATASEIAYRVGFSSPSYFNKVFKQHFNISPGDVRKGAATSQYHMATEQTKEITYSNKFNISHWWLYLVIVSFAIIILVGGVLILSKGKNPKEKSIAILPFDNLSSDKENQYFADGIVEDLLDRLSTIKDLKVISRTSTEMFRNKGNKSVPEIAEILGVKYILEGTVQKNLDKIRISVQLIDAKKDDHILSKQFERNLSDLFELQSEIALKVAAELDAVLTEQQTSEIQRNYTTNTKAFEFYQIGRFHASKRWIEGYKKSIEYYEKAIAEDPDYGLAFAGLSDTYHLMAIQGWIDKNEGKEKAIQLAHRALELDPSLAGPHTVLGSLYTYIDWDWEKAEKEFRKAIELNPNYSTAHQYYSELLTILHRDKEAREHIDKATELDPFSFIIRFINGMQYYTQGKFKETLSEFEICHDLVGNHQWLLRMEFEIYYQLRMENEAIKSFKQYGKYFHCYDPSITDSVYANEGLDGLLRVKIKGEGYQLIVASDYILLGEYEKAIDILEKEYSKNNIGDPMYFSKFEFRRIQENPRYIALLKKMGLPPPP